METVSLVESYTTLGALGFSFVILMAIIIYWIKSINPALKQLTAAVGELKFENQNYKGALDNNTKALEAVAKSVEEVAKSNQNIANMVQTFSNALDNQAKIIEKHDDNLTVKFEDTKDLIDNLKLDLKSHDTRGERVEVGLGKLKSVIEIQTVEFKAALKVSR